MPVEIIQHERKRAGTLTQSLEAQLRKIQAPRLLLLSERDNHIGEPGKVAQRARRLIPRLQVEIIPGAGHMMSTDAPEIVNAHILRILRE